MTAMPARMKTAGQQVCPGAALAAHQVDDDGAHAGADERQADGRVNRGVVDTVDEAVPNLVLAGEPFVLAVPEALHE